jgi:REP element-mobilizing transposase RayT
MTAPRQVLPGKTHLVTRRCSERRFFLRPSRIVNDIFLYVLAVAAKRCNIRVHVACVLSNHYHVLVTDPDARLPEFEQYLDSLVARATNASLGRFEGFWAAATSYSAVGLAGPEDVVAKAAYVLANPVAAGLVQTGSEWPGIWTAPDKLGSAKLVARRPKGFFREDGYMPAVVELELTVPPGFASAAEFQELVGREVRALETKIRRDRAAERLPFLGRVKVLAQKPFARPRPGESRFRLNPRVAAVDTWKRKEAISRLKAFLAEYRAAWRRLREGAPGVLFPPGTYHLRVVHRIPCAAAAA